MILQMCRKKRIYPHKKVYSNKKLQFSKSNYYILHFPYQNTIINFIAIINHNDIYSKDFMPEDIYSDIEKKTILLLIEPF